MCTVCSCAEGSLPVHCPGKKVGSRDQERIHLEGLDFKDGKWSEPVEGDVTSKKALDLRVGDVLLDSESRFEILILSTHLGKPEKGKEGMLSVVVTTAGGKPGGFVAYEDESFFCEVGGLVIRKAFKRVGKPFGPPAFITVKESQYGAVMAEIYQPRDEK